MPAKTRKLRKPGPKPVVYLVRKDRRFEVRPGHFYSSTCRCMDCLQHFLAWSEGVIEMRSHDGKHRMLPPGS